MARPIRRILVAIKEVRGRSSPTLAKAAKLATALGARLELFHAITVPLAIDAFTFSGEGVKEYETAEHARRLKRLEAMAQPLRDTGLKVTVSAVWDYPAHQAVIRQAMQTRADLIVAERHEGRHVAPWLLRYNDRELLRHSPVPVLLVKTRRAYDKPKVLAAVDPSHAFNKAAGLDTNILRLAASVALATKGDFHAVHAYVPSLVDLPASMLTRPDATQRIVRESQAHAKARFAKAVRAARLGELPRGRSHVVPQHPVDAIPALAREYRFDLVVMGLARTGVKSLLIGNTAEHLLDDLACDLLVVKPPGFASSVPKEPKGPQYVSMGGAFSGF